MTWSGRHNISIVYIGFNLLIIIQNVRERAPVNVFRKTFRIQFHNKIVICVEFVISERRITF